MSKDFVLLRTSDLTARLGITKVTLYAWIRERGFPKGRLLGSRRVWTPADQAAVEQWIEDQPRRLRTDIPCRWTSKTEAA